MNSKVDAFLSKARKWREEMTRLRAILLDCGLTEEFKWGKPCYTFQNANVVIVAAFKEHCVLILCKGALLKDPAGILIKPGENTQAARQIRLTGIREITEKETVLKTCIQEAVAVEQAGLEVSYAKSTDLAFPEELQRKLDEDALLKTAFEALTPGRRRAYNIYFSAPKQSKTRESRINKCIQQILDGKGLNDDYRSTKNDTA